MAIDAKGNVSKPATVKVNIQKQSTTVSYSDLEGDPAHYAALRLAEAGVYTGVGEGGGVVLIHGHLAPGGAVHHLEGDQVALRVHGG